MTEEESALNKKIFKVLNYLLYFLYVCFVFLWFKDNIHPLKKISTSYLLPLIPMIGILLIKFFFRVKSKKIKIHCRLNKVFWAGLILVLLALAFRIPFLAQSYALMTSDHAIPALMAKHISEGKLPPVYYYGQFYMGSLSQHIFALMFLIFGYSIFLLKFTTLLFYFAFIAIQFILIKEILSFRLSFIISLFYCLPIGHLIPVSFDNTGAFSLVLLLGSSIIYITFLIYWKNKENLIPFLGFLIGISFWTHQITVSFILTSMTVLLFKFKLRLKRYFSLFLFFSIGCFPILMLEIFEKFKLLKFLIPEKFEGTSWEKLKTTFKLTLALISLETHSTSLFFLVFLFLGFLTLIYFSLKKRKLQPQSMYSIFFMIFFLIYLFSAFSEIPAERYLYPLYFCLPVLLVSPFMLVKSRKKYLLSFVLILILLFPYNLKQSYHDFLASRDLNSFLNQVLTAMKATGKQYWRGDYWTAYLLTALSKEDIIVDSYTINRYYPYTLLYYNESRSENFVFLRGPEHIERDRAVKLMDLLDTLNINFKKEKAGEAWLIYDVKYSILENTFNTPVPSQIPNPVLSQVSSLKGHLYLNFQNTETGNDLEYRLNVEIPGYSSGSWRVIRDDKEMNVRIPFPMKKSFKIRYYMEYLRLKIESTVRELYYYPSDDELKERNRILYLTGFRPAVDFQDKKMRVCEKFATIEINDIFRRRIKKIQFYLYSPFEFFHPYWYGNYSQKMRIEINGSLLKDKTLKEGYNLVEIDGSSENFSLKEGTNTITLRFKYHLPFDCAPLWRTAALLEKVTIE